jgi:hypothetical protein
LDAPFFLRPAAAAYSGARRLKPHQSFGLMRGGECDGRCAAGRIVRSAVSRAGPDTSFPRDHTHQARPYDTGVIAMAAFLELFPREQPSDGEFGIETEWRWER